MIWLVATYVIGIFPAVAVIAAFDEWTSNFGGLLPPSAHVFAALFWPIALLVALVWCPICVSTLWLSKLGTRLAKKYKLKRLKKERDGI